MSQMFMGNCNDEMWWFCELAWVHILYQKYLFLFYFQAKPVRIRPSFVFISMVVGGRLKMSFGTMVKSFGWRSWINLWPWCLVLISCLMSNDKKRNCNVQDEDLPQFVYDMEEWVSTDSDMISENETVKGDISCPMQL